MRYTHFLFSVSYLNFTTDEGGKYRQMFCIHFNIIIDSLDVEHWKQTFSLWQPLISMGDEI